MTWDQYWYGDVWMVEAFRRAERHRIERMNQTFWLQGRYFYDALCGASPVFRDFVKRGTKPIPYLEKPYLLFEEEEKEKTQKQEESEAARAKAYMMQMVRAGKNWGKRGDTNAHGC